LNLNTGDIIRNKQVRVKGQPPSIDRWNERPYAIDLGEILRVLSYNEGEESTEGTKKNWEGDRIGGKSGKDE
jgi:hypothetical protein